MPLLERKIPIAPHMAAASPCSGQYGITGRPTLFSRYGDMLVPIVLFIIVLVFTGNVYAKENNILILLSGNEDVYLDVATTITNSTIKLCRDRHLECQDTNFEIGQISSLKEKFTHEHRLIVTLGNKAAVFAKNHLRDERIFSALITKNSNIKSANGIPNPSQYYFYLDQPLQRSLLLIKALSDRFKNIGVVISSSDTISARVLENSAARLDLALNIEKVDSIKQIGASLNRLLNSVGVLLAVPDTKIHNKSTVSNILISAYRKRIPLIGFSSAYVKAGALAAVYSSPEDIAYHVRDNIVKYYSGVKIENKEQMAEYFTVLFNSDVARSLDFPIKSEFKLQRKMIKMLKDDHD